ncbi:MAG: hypothetical protein F6K36_03235 [Symploca sp. SIO3C6]|uniref:Uncharacterized protein n=1 Tax=Symploca sp. SIO1C4 TaxID=2607765 RepID=A0A6B3NDE6_9CYAN|nr:hypothetical protein [Symploca sp. SIO3C6]NER28144.1 hypothetical protein [Symploca sp. SIO1C4]NET03884.1 hypothetical protein [Symploca sp. SIO2B6]
MSFSATGVIEYQDIGSGVWALVTEDGVTYELKDLPPVLQSSQLQVQIEGEIREDIMTLAMIGPVLEVQSFEIL